MDYNNNKSIRDMSYPSMRVWWFFSFEQHLKIENRVREHNEKH